MNADVLYLTVDAETGAAWIGGVITKSNYEEYGGVEFLLPVYDGSAWGEPDQIGYTYFGYPADFALYKIPGLEMFEFTHGNLQLK